MTQLSKSAFLSKWGGLFADNSNREISEQDLRDFRQDIADSFLNLLDDFGINVPLIFCEDADLSSNLFPTTGGTGTSGAIKKGNVFRVSVAGAPGGYSIDVNAEIRALVDTPGQTLANWWIRI